MGLYKLANLLPETAPLPYFKAGDRILFPSNQDLHPADAAIKCADLLRQDLQDTHQIDEVRSDKGDSKGMRERLFGKGLITGLSILDLILTEQGDHQFLLNETPRPAVGWMGKMTITQSLPGIDGSIASEFPYAALLYTSHSGTVFRTGPYDPTTGKIGAIYDPELQALRLKSKKIGAGAFSSGVSRKRGRADNGIDGPQ